MNQLSWAVSYTHLDVYKRQTVYWCILQQYNIQVKQNSILIIIYNSKILDMQLHISISVLNKLSLNIFVTCSTQLHTKMLVQNVSILTGVLWKNMLFYSFFILLVAENYKVQNKRIIQFVNRITESTNKKKTEIFLRSW